ncbi:hydrogenase subunit MbhD domain-containing protein [Reyranella sp.]|uniref:hydrogenase subunit MbhD domain-containing protein n=1 Tax=Reyranella sp. TaxID=1929291 RepID=UPI00378322EA
MTLIDILDIGLAIVVLAVAGWTIAARDSFAAAVGYVAYGLLLSLVWLRLFAPDVALTEAAIGSGVTGVLLMTAAVRLRHTSQAGAGAFPGAGTRVAAALLCLIVTGALAAVILAPVDIGASLAPAAALHLESTGLGNPVTAVLMAYRAFDTMLEKGVLIMAVIAVWSLADDRAWGGRAGPLSQAPSDGALALLARLLPPIGIVVGIHIAWVGANDPGGAFQGGALLAAMALLVVMAGLVEAPAVASRWLRIVIVAGPATFLLAGGLGFAIAAGFLAWPVGWAKALILAVEAFMVLSIAATLPLLVIGPPQRPPAGHDTP